MEHNFIKSQEMAEGWKNEDSQVFWSVIAPSDHVVQIYDNDKEFLDLLYNFVIGGIRAGESVIVIATEAHLLSLNDRMREQGYDPFHLKVKDKYIPLDASESLSKFMVGNRPDENLFFHFANNALLRAKRHSHHVRAFGEMVALLMAEGQTEATVELEELWNQFADEQSFSLLCAYPRAVFANDAETSIRHICCTHKKVVATGIDGLNNILYKDVKTAFPASL